MREKVYVCLKRMLEANLRYDTYSDILEYLEDEVAKGNIPRDLYMLLASGQLNAAQM